MKKFLLLFAMMLALGSTNAITKKIYPTFKSVNNSNISWSLADKKFTITGDENYKGGNNTYEIFSFAAGTLTSDTKIHIPISNTKSRVLFMAGTTTKTTWNFGSTGTKNSKMSEVNSGAGVTDLDQITSIRIAGPSQGSEVISTPIELIVDPDELYLEIPQTEGMQITTPIAEFEWYNYSTNEVYGHSGSQLLRQIGSSVAGNNQVLFGPYSANATTAYMNVEGYDNALVSLSAAGVPGIRFMYDSSTETIETDVNNKFYIQDLSSMSKIATIKTKNGSGDYYFTIGSINFNKSFLASSTTTFNISASLASTIAYDREFTVGQKSTVCLPFALTADEVSAAGKFYELKSEAEGMLTFAPVETTEAYKPYIFEAKTATPFNNLTNKAIVASSAAETSYTKDGYTFKGVLAASSNVQGDNTGKVVYGYNGGTFVKVNDDDISIKAFRAYIVGPAAPGARGFLDTEFNDGTTGIQEINVQSEDAADAPAYNLAGQRVNANHKGIIIKGGKKYIVK